MDEHLTHFSKVSPKRSGARHLKVYPKYVFYPCCITACSNQCLRSINPATGVQKIQTEEDSTLSWGNLGDYFVQLQKGLLGTTWPSAIKRSSRKLCNPNQQGMTHCKTSLAQCRSISHHNSSSYAERHKKNPSPGRGEHHQVLYRSLSNQFPCNSNRQPPGNKVGGKTCTE